MINKRNSALRSQKSQSQKRFVKAVAGVEQDGGKGKKKRKMDGNQGLPEVSRIEVEEVVITFFIT